MYSQFYCKKSEAMFLFYVLSNNSNGGGGKQGQLKE